MARFVLLVKETNIKRYFIEATNREEAHKLWESDGFIDVQTEEPDEYDHRADLMMVQEVK